MSYYDTSYSLSLFIILRGTKCTELWDNKFILGSQFLLFFRFFVISDPWWSALLVFKLCISHLCSIFFEFLFSASHPRLRNVCHWGISRQDLSPISSSETCNWWGVLQVMRDELSFVCVPVFSRGGAKHRFLDIDIDTRRVSSLSNDWYKGNTELLQKGKFTFSWTSAAWHKFDMVWLYRSIIPMVTRGLF